MKVLVTGAAGFICGYLVADLLQAGHEVIGVDNFSKYGPVKRGFDGDPRYRLVEGDAKDATLLTELAADCDQLVAGAAMIGGISYFHEFAYDLLAENERICAATFDAAISAHGLGRLQKITVVSSSMVFESASVFPTPEGAQLKSPPPRSTYGFQKLATEFFAHGAREQYGLPFTIVRPFNCVGVGERRALRDRQVMSGNVKLAMSHVVPDLCQKALKDQDPLHILGDGSQVRHYTYGGDLARGIRMAMESSSALNEDFNLSTAQSTTVRELAEVIWRKVHGPERPLHLVSDAPYEHDVQMRVPDVHKAREVLGFEATTSLDEMLDEVIPWIREEIEAGPDLIGNTPALTDTPALSVVIPVYNEGENVVPTLRGVVDRTHTRPLEVLVVHDFDEDTTVPVVKRLQAEMPELRLHRNTLGRGVLNAMKSGLRAARAAYVLVTMGDGSDDPNDIDAMYELARGGADVVAGSRYVRGGHQLGGPLLKRTMSRAAGLSLHWLGGVPVHDATSNFRLYSKRLLNQVTIESTGGFELGLELTVKAHLLGMRVAEVPTTWRDRTAGQSRFQLWQWLPRYLKWYRRGLAGRFTRS